MPGRPGDVRTWVEIDRRALLGNYERFHTLARGVPVMAVVKSNAYGHDLRLVARVLATLPSFRKSGWFGVDSIVEALALRRAGIRQPILVLGYTLPARFAEAAKRRITLTISNFEALHAVIHARKRPDFHLKLDTGMHRLGFQEHEVRRLIAVLQRSRLAPAGVYSHLAAAQNHAASRRQIATFERCLGALRSASIAPGIVHMNKTEGIIYHPQSNYGMVRLGIGLYGYLPAGRDPKIRPVMTWKTIIGEVKRVAKGERIGYDFTKRLRRDTAVAVLPVGYWHGFDRGLSNIGAVLIRGRRAPVLGRVCMDMTAVDVTGIPTVRSGDEAVIIGRRGRKRIGADEIGAITGTTAYEVLTRVNPLIRRIAR